MKKHINNKMILVLSILLVFILAGAVSSASDDVDTISDDSSSEDVMALDSVKETDTVSMDADEQKVSSGESEVLSDESAGSFTELSNLIENSQSNTIELTKNYTYNSDDSTEGIIISKNNIIIDGNRHAIDGDAKTKILTITGNNVTLKNIIIKGANIDYPVDTMFINITDHDKIISSCNGAGINWLGDSGKLLDSFILNNRLAGWFQFENTTEYNMKYYIGNGAGVYWGGNNGLIENVKFDNNTLESNTVIHVNYTESTSNILRIVGSGSSLAVTGSNVIVSDCNFNKDEIRSGSSIYENIDEFTNWITGENYLHIDNIYAQGNVLFHGDNGIIRCSDFNNASLKFTGNNGQVINSSFYNGMPQKYTWNEKWIKDTVPAVDWGNGKWSNLGSNGTITLSKFYNNHANMKLSFVGSKGSIFWSGAKGTISYSNFTNNSAYHGSAIYWTGFDGNVLQNVFKDNTAVSTEPIFSLDTNLNIQNNDIDDSNKILNSFAIDFYKLLNSNNIIKLEHDMVSNGIVIINKSNIIIDGQGYTIDGNASSIFDIPVYNVTIKNIKFNNAKASYDESHGGALVWEGSFGILQNASFTNCRSYTNAGAIVWLGPYGQLNNLTFDNCTSGFVGGALMFRGDAFNSTISNSTFTNCKSSYGGSLYNNYIENITVIGCHFENNTASVGADIAWKGTGIISNVTFENSHASSGGAFFFDTGSCNTTVDSCDFKNCSADKSGGAIVFSSNSLEGNSISNSNFKDCISGEQGGAISSSSDYSFNINNCDFENSTAGKGGAVFGNIININDSSFYQCSSAEGGSIFAKNNVTINNSNFTNSTAEIGSVISAKNINIKDSIVENCSGSTEPLFAEDVNKNNVTEKNNDIEETFASYIRSQLLKSNIVTLDRDWNVSSSANLITDNIIINGNNHIIKANSTVFNVDANNVTIKNFNFITCNYSDSRLIVWNGNDGQLISSNFENCSSDGVIFNSNSKNCLVYNSNFTNLNGNAIFNYGSNLTINKSNIKNCKNGGFKMYSTSGNIVGVIIKNSNFSNCSLSNEGSAIRSMRGIIKVYNTTFSDFNDASNDREIIHLEAGSNSEFIECNFYSSNIMRAVHLKSPSIFYKCNFTGLKSTSIYIDSCGDVVINNSRFDDIKNTALAWWANGATKGVLIVDSIFTNCSREEGSVFRFVGSNFTVSNNTLINNKGIAIWEKEDYNSGIINSNVLINSSIKNSLKDVSEFNWYGNNQPTDVNSFLELKCEKVYDSLIMGEWNGALDIYFVKNGTDERVDVSWGRPISYTQISNNVDIDGEFTDYVKLCPTNGEEVVISVKVDNQELGQFNFDVTNNHGFTELQNLIKGTKSGETLVLNNNYTFNPTDDASLIDGVVIDKPITIVGNGSTISGSNSAKNIFKITSKDVVLENITINGTTNTGITSTANNTKINNLKADNIKNTVIDIVGDNAVINNIVANSGEGIVVNIKGDYPSVRNITSNRQGQLIYINGKGAEGSLNIIIGDITYPDNAQANITSLVDGVYIININGKQYPVTVKDGKGTVTITDVLDAKQYNATIQSNMTSYDVSANTTFTVNKAKITDLRISADNVAYPNNPIAVINTNVDGEYIVNINGKPYTVTVKDGKGNVTLDLLTVGTYIVSVMSNVSNYDVVSNSTSFSIVNGTISELNVIVDSVTYPDTGIVLISASVDGEYIVNVNNQNYTVTVKDGKGNVTLDLLPAGTYMVSVESRIVNYDIASNSTNFIVNKSQDTIVIIDVNPSLIHDDDSFNITVNIDNANGGNVTVSIPETGFTTTIAFENKTIVIPFKDFTAGNYTINVIYLSDAGNVTVGNKSFVVKNWNFTELQQIIDLAIAENKTADLGNHTYVREDGEDAIKVNDTVKINGENAVIDANGKDGAFDITADGVELNNMTVVNVADNGVAIDVTGNDTKISDVTLNDNNGTGIKVDGNNATISEVTLNNNTGKGIVVDGDNSTVSDVTGNNHTGDLIDITGNDNSVAGTTSNDGNGTAVNVKGDNNKVEDTTGNDHEGTLVAVDGNENTVANATANGGNGTAVDVKNGNNNTINGVNSTGNHTGADLVDNGNGTKKSAVKPANPDTAFDLSKANADPAVFTINLPSDATGNFTVSVGGKDYTAKVVNGTATVSVPGLASGDQSVVVSYSGDGQYSPIFKTATVTIPKPVTPPVPAKKATVITAKNKVTFKKSKRSKTKTFKLTLKEKIGGKKLSGKTVLFKLTNVNKIKLTNKVKKAIKKANAKVKKAKIAVKKAKGKAAKAKAKKKLAKAKKALTKAKKPQTMLKQLKKGTYKVKTKNGVAKLTLSKNSFIMKKFKGKNIKLTAKFNGDDSYLKSSKTVKVVIK